VYETAGPAPKHGPDSQVTDMKVEITIPIYNEEEQLAASIGKLVRFTAGLSQFETQVVIADNASTDRSWEIAQELARTHANVRAHHLPRKGRGGALKEVWSQSTADVVSYMDVDLSTNLSFFPLLVQGLVIGYDVAIGSRLLQASQTMRSPKREVISRAYNMMVKGMFLTRFSDAQCGFKALRREVAQALLPHVQNKNWFFDTEILLLAEKHGFRIFEVPVEWIEDMDSRVKLVSTITEDVKGLLRMRVAGFGQKVLRPVYPVGQGRRVGEP
jgi:glycosyltransferase involved in cell wall biosynthesis